MAGWRRAESGELELEPERVAEYRQNLDEGGSRVLLVTGAGPFERGEPALLSLQLQVQTTSFQEHCIWPKVTQ